MLALRVPCASRHDWALRNSLRSNSARAYPITYSDAQLRIEGIRGRTIVISIPNFPFCTDE